MEDTDRLTIEVPDTSYQPTKAELEEDVSIDATPEEVARAIMQPVKIKELTKPS